MSPEVVEVLEERRWLFEERNDSDEGVTISADRLREETERVRRELKEGPANYTYLTSEMVSTPRGVVKHESTGMIGGLEINGEMYALEAGHNRCFLRHYRVDEHGRGYHVSTEDVRDRDFIDTDNYGRITIRKRRAGSPASRWLSRIAKKTAEWSGDVYLEFG